MFKKKSRPELYEILQTNKSGSGKSGSQKAEITSLPVISTTSGPQAHPVGEPKSESHPAGRPVRNTQTGPANADKAQPKPKIPFPTSAPANGPSAFSGLKKYLVPVLMIIAIIAVVVLIIYQFKSSSEKMNAPGSAVTAPKSFWSNQMIYYPDTPEGQRNTDDAIAYLKLKDVRDVFSQKKTMENVTNIFIYAGRYATKAEGVKDQPRLKQLNPNFKHVETVTVEVK